MRRIYLDDIRPAPEGWTRARWPSDVIAALLVGDVAEVSLDHDLGDDRMGTGYDVLLWIERAVVERGFTPPSLRVHSANPVARKRMLAAIAAIEQIAAARGRP